MTGPSQERTLSGLGHWFRNNAVRLQLHALAHNLGKILRTLALPKEVAHWSLTTPREKLIKIGAKVIRHGRYITFQLAEVVVSRALLAQILGLIADLRAPPKLDDWGQIRMSKAILWASYAQARVNHV